MGFRQLPCRQQEHGEAGTAYLPEPIGGRPPHGRAVRGTGTRVHAEDGVRRPALHRLSARGHRPQACPYRLHLCKGERRKNQ
jgi:hypothetical protein